MKLVFALAAMSTALGARAVAAPKSAADDITYAVGFVCENSLQPHVNDDMFTDGATVFASGSRAKVADGLTHDLANLHAPKTVQVELASDKQSAWFQTTCRGEATYAHSADDCARSKAKRCDANAIAFHAMGHIVHTGTWKIDQLVMTATESNADTLARGENPLAMKHAMPGPATVEQTGDAGLAKAVIGWFADDLAKSAADGTVLAAGTAPGEIGMNVAARKLVTSWASLHMVVASVDATVTGDRGVVTALVRFETKTKAVIELHLTALAVKQGDAWRWQLIDFVT